MGEQMYSLEDALRVSELSFEFGRYVSLIWRRGYRDEIKRDVEELLKKMMPYRQLFEPLIEKYSKEIDVIGDCHLQIPDK